MDLKTVAMWVVLALLAWFVLTPKKGDVDGAQARALVAAGATLVDVRTPAEFADAHVPGAINVPVEQLGGRLGDLGRTDRELVLYCRSGSRSSHAARQLRAAGFTKVHDLGPMSAW